LAGTAAHSAILAWFGGGALAAGGGGVALGTLALGAIVTLPLVAYSAYKSYKEASRIDQERDKVVAASSENKKNTDELLRLKLQAKALRQEVIERRERFAVEFTTIRDEATRLAHRMARTANSFATDLVDNARNRGATV
jgi:uncharacterized membrane protein YebE (DUF533 family)